MRDFAAIVGIRRLPSKQPPPSNPSPGELGKDVVVEAMVLDRRTGRTLVVGRELDRWPLREKRSPLWVRWMGSRLIVAWVRGQEGFGYAALDPASTSVAPVHVDAPADELAFAGCDTARCYAIALARGDRAPGTSEGAEAGVAHVLAFP